MSPRALSAGAFFVLEGHGHKGLSAQIVRKRWRWGNDRRHDASAPEDLKGESGFILNMVRGAFAILADFPLQRGAICDTMHVYVCGEVRL